MISFKMMQFSIPISYARRAEMASIESHYACAYLEPIDPVALRVPEIENLRDRKALDSVTQVPKEHALFGDTKPRIPLHLGTVQIMQSSIGQLCNAAKRIMPLCILDCEVASKRP